MESFEHESMMSAGRSSEGMVEKEDRQEFKNFFKPWEGDYTSVLAEYGIC
jgi:hypothetical protein